jgi:hypothetical protein
MDAVIEVLVRDVGERTSLNLQEQIRDLVTGQGLTLDSIETFTPAETSQTELAATASGSARVRVYEA